MPTDTTIKLRLLKTVLGELVEWHPFYIYVKISHHDPRIPPFVPYYHQLELLLNLLHRPVVRVLIGDEIGLGKTVEAIMILRILESRLREEGRRPKFLIIVPRVLVEQWVSELRRARIEFVRMLVTRESLDALQKGPVEPGYYVASLHLIRRQEHSHKITNIDWDAIVVDEAHNIGYGSLTNTTLSYKLVHELTRQPRRSVILLTATPHRGKPDDYIARLLLLVPELPLNTILKQAVKNRELDSREFYSTTHNTILFRRNKEYVNALEGKKIFKEARFLALLIHTEPNEELYEKRLLNFVRRIVKDVGPSIWETNTPASLILTLLMKRATSSIRASLETLATILNTLSTRSATSPAEKSTAMNEIENYLSGGLIELENDPDESIKTLIQGARRDYSAILARDRDYLKTIKDLVKLARDVVAKGDSKLKSLCELLSHLTEQGKKVVVFTEFRDTLTYIMDRLKKCLSKEIRITCVSGATSGECSRSNVEEIKEKLSNGELDVVIATDVASEGLNLQKASVIINYDVPWSPVRLEQRLGRVWRIGQEREVEVYNFFRKTEIDLEIMNNLYMKILNIKEATSKARPLIGEDISVYAKGSFMTISQLYRDSIGEEGPAPPLTPTGRAFEVEVARRIIEGKGKLDSLAQEFLKRIIDLNRELRKKNVYPRTRTLSLRERKEGILNELVGEEETDNGISKYIISQATHLKKTLNMTSYYAGESDEISTVDQSIKELSRIWYRIWPRRDILSLEPGVYESSIAKDTLVIVPLNIVSDGRIICRELIGIKLVETSAQQGMQILRGPLLLNEVIQLLEGDLSFKEKAGAKKYVEFIERARRIIENKFHRTNTFYSRMKRQMKEFTDTLINALKNSDENINETAIREAFSHGQMQVKANIEGSIVIVPQSRTWAENVSYTVFTEGRLEVERMAIKGIVTLYEKNNNRSVLDVHELMMPFDVLSLDPRTGRIQRMIEVKGHFDENYEVLLTESEYTLAKKLGSNYWLYLVTNVGGGKVCLYAINDPTNRLGFNKIKRNGKTFYRVVVDTDSGVVDDRFCINTLAGHNKSREKELE